MILVDDDEAHTGVQRVIQTKLADHKSPLNERMFLDTPRTYVHEKKELLSYFTITFAPFPFSLCFLFVINPTRDASHPRLDYQLCD